MPGSTRSYHRIQELSIFTRFHESNFMCLLWKYSVSVTASCNSHDVSGAGGTGTCDTNIPCCVVTSSRQGKRDLHIFDSSRLLL